MILNSSESSEVPDSHFSSRKGNSPAWFEAQDLQVLKAWNNDIIEIQHEISLFGALKVIDVCYGAAFDVVANWDIAP